MALAWFQGNRGLVLGVGCGVLIGMSGTLIIQQLSNGIDQRLAQLVSQLDSLRYEIDQLKSQLPDSRVSAVKGGRERKVRMGYYSVHPSSGEDDDDDDFQEAP